MCEAPAGVTARTEGSATVSWSASASASAWAALSRAIPSSVDNGRFVLPVADVDEDACSGLTGAKRWEAPPEELAALKFPGVELKTEYSSANRGVQAEDESSR